MDMNWVVLLHGMGGSRDGTVKKLEEALLPLLKAPISVTRPQMPHSDPNRPGEDSVDYLDQLSIPFGALVVGISLGGLVAAKLQEAGRPDLRVIAISSPTWGAGIHLRGRQENRVAVYSSQDTVIADRTQEWPKLAAAYDLSWLTHHTDKHLSDLSLVIAAYANGDNWRARLTALERRKH